MLNRKGISFFLSIEKLLTYSNVSRGEGVAFSILIGPVAVYCEDLCSVAGK
jgi:hypothetical protein